jgi:hypothetical protein
MSIDEGVGTRIARRLAWAVAVGFVLVMAAGADRPPPPGFVLVLVLAVGLGVLVRLLLPLGLATWSDAGSRAALTRAGATGAAFAALMWAVASLVSGGEPSVDVGAGARIVGLVVVVLLGALGAMGVLAVGRGLERRTVSR